MRGFYEVKLVLISQIGDSATKVEGIFSRLDSGAVSMDTPWVCGLSFFFESFASDHTCQISREGSLGRRPTTAKLDTGRSSSRSGGCHSTQSPPGPVERVGSSVSDLRLEPATHLRKRLVLGFPRLRGAFYEVKVMLIIRN